ncbi:MAG: endonuclease, partial [Ignavibacteria bacterium]
MNFKTILLAAIAAVFIIASGNTNAQNVPGIVTFDTTLTNVTGSANVYVRNPTAQTITYSVRTLTGNYIISSNNFTVDTLDSVLYTLNFRTNQNITYYDFLIFESPDLNYSIVYYLTATAKYPDAVYSFTQGLIDEPLKLALKNFCSTNTNNNYTTSRTAMFSTIDDYNMDDTIECVYTGRKVYTTGIPSVNPPQSMNTEHTFPQGFFNQDEPMRSDVHHL